MSRVTAIISALVICIIVCLSWAVNHCRDNAITYVKPSATKMPENWAAPGWQLLTPQTISVMLPAPMQNKEIVMLVKMILCVMIFILAAGRRQLRIKAVCQSVREATTASGVDNAASPLADTAERDCSPSERGADHYAKTTGRNPEVY